MSYNLNNNIISSGFACFKAGQYRSVGYIIEKPNYSVARFGLAEE